MKITHFVAAFLVPLTSLAYYDNGDEHVTVSITGEYGQKQRPISLPLNELVGWSNFVLKDELAFVGKHVFGQPGTITRAEILYDPGRTACTFTANKSQVRIGYFTASKPFVGSIENANEFSCVCII